VNKNFVEAYANHDCRAGGMLGNFNIFIAFCRLLDAKQHRREMMAGLVSNWAVKKHRKVL